MKVALITDTHCGIRNDSPALLTIQDRFYSEIFWPKIDELGIKRIAHLGDYFDRRKYINFNTLDRNFKSFIHPLFERTRSGLGMDLLIGNHDTFFKNTNALNSPRQLLPIRDASIRLIETKPEVITYGELEVGFVPWICEENYDECMEFLATTSAEVIMGHFEIAGFEVFKGQVMQHGLSQDLFRRFDLVFSGHYHHKSQIGNIHYLGSPHEATWADYDDPRGFHIFDTTTRELEFVENPIKAFMKIVYDDEGLVLDELLKEDFSECRDKYVRIVVERKTDPYMLEKVIEKIQNEFPPKDLTVMENYEVTFKSVSEPQLDEDGVPVDEPPLKEIYSEDTLALVEMYIDALPVERKSELKDFFRVLYLEAADLLV